MKIFLCLFIFIYFSDSYSATAQVKAVNREKFRIHVVKSRGEMNLDGVLDEDAWKTAERVTDFQCVLPIDTGIAKAATCVMLTYDSDNLYLGIICYDTLPGRRPAESLRRDFVFGKSDNFITFIDTYNDQTNGFSFGVSAAGAQWDGLQANGGTVALEWDTKWKSEVKNYPDRWEAEFAIPFHSIRYNEGETEWGINFSRLDLKSNEKSSWAPMPRQFPTASLAYTGTLIWDNPPPKAGVRFSIIPYVSGNMIHNSEKGENPKYSGTAGADAKISLSTSLNLDLTVNPDFSQVEVDLQRTNLERYELFFPEKRQFFLENSDLFASLGKDNIRPFFSRRIGLNSPVQAGFRLSGKLENDWRIGVMDIQTDAKDTIDAANFATIAIQRKVLKRSNIAAFMINKQLMGVNSDSVMNPYNRLAGIDFNLASRDNRWTGKFFYHQSFFDNSPGDAFAAVAFLEYNTQHISAFLGQSWVGNHFTAETGFVPRTGFYELNPLIQYKFYPKSATVANHGISFKMDMFFSTELQKTDHDATFSYFVEWLQKHKLTLELKNTFVELYKPFDPTNTGGIQLDSASRFNWNEIGTNFLSDTRRLLNVDITARYGGFYNGTKLGFTGNLFYRIQPYASIAASVSYNKIELPEPYNSAQLVLIGPRIDVTFTDKVFLTTLMQYNNQIDNFNLNIRFQWRFAPVSDLFIVYTGNVYPENFKTKNRGVAIKLSYWFN